MPRQLVGLVDRKGSKFRARLGALYLGVFDSERDAWDAIADAKALRQDKETNTVRELAGEWFKARELGGEVKKIKKQQSDWRHRIEKHAKFLDWPVRRVRTVHVQALLARLAKQPAHQVINRKGRDGAWVPEYRETGETLSRESVNKALSLLKLFFDWCIREGKTDHNPARAAKNPVRKVHMRKSAQRIIHPTEQEIANLFALELPAKERAVFATAIYTGLRRAEIWGMRWEHVDFDSTKPHIRVRNSYDGDVKSATSIREVPLLPFARAALLAYRDALPVRPITGLVFPADGGGCHSEGYDCGWRDMRGYRGRSKKGRVWLGWRAKAGIRREVTFRTLRHGTGVHLLSGTFLGNAEPFTLKQVSALLGHSSEKVTERHYAYLLPGNIHDAAHGKPERKTERKNDLTL